MSSRADAMPRRAFPSAAALLLYLAYGVALLWPALLGDQVLSASASFVREGPFPSAVRNQAPEGLDFYSDSVCCFDPWLRFAADAFATDGRIPLWKPTGAAGAPFVGNGQSAIYFPTQLLAVLLGAPPVVHALAVLFKLVAGAFCAWLLAQHLRLSFAASLVCGLAFGFGGFQMGFSLHPITNVSLLLPLLVLAADRLVLAPSAGRAALLAAGAALQHFGGHPETVFHCQVAVLALSGARAASLRRSIGGAVAARRLLWVAGALGLGAALAAIQLWPLLEYLAQSAALHQRAQELVLPSREHPLAAAGFGAALVVALLALRRLATAARGLLLSTLLLGVATLGCVYAGLQAGLVPSFVLLMLPDWFGDPQRYLGPAVYIGESAAFVGAALPLAALGLLQGRPRGPVLAAGVVALIGLLAGYTAPLLEDLLQLLPGFHLALNARLGLLALLAFAVLAGFGVDALGQVALQARARWRLAGAVLAPTLGALLALTLAARNDSVRSHDYPGVSKGVAFVDARLLPASKAERFFADEARRVPAQASKVIYGYVVPGPPHDELRLLYGRNGRRAELRARRAPVWAQFPRAAEAGVMVFRATIPPRDLQYERTRVRLQLLDHGRVVAESGLMVSPDEPRPRWPFPSRPARAAVGATTQMLLLLGVALGFALLAPVGGLSRAALRVAVPVLVAASLWSFDRGLVPLLPGSLYFPPSPAADVLRGARPDGRMLSLRPEQLAAEIPTQYGLADLRGYDGLGPARVERLLDAALRRPAAPVGPLEMRPQQPPDFALLGLMSVRFLVGLPDAPHGFVRVPVPVPLTIVENPHFLPRARLVGAAVVEPDDERAQALLQDPGFRGDWSVVLAAGAGAGAGAGADAGAGAPQAGAETLTTTNAAGGAASAPGVARIVHDRPDCVIVRVEPTAPGWLVLTDTFFPGWVARVDGQPREIARANVAFRAVAVRPGDQSVEFRYEPLSARGGALVSLLSAVAIAAWCLLSRRRARVG